MSTAKAPLSVVTRIFVLSLDGTIVNWYYRLAKSTAFLKQYEPNTKLRISVRDLELAKQKRNKSLSDSLTRFMNNTNFMKNKLTEKDQVGMIIWDILPNLVKRL